MSARPPIKNLRWYIAGMLCLSTALNYLDRQTLSVLATTIQHDLGMTNVQYARLGFWFLIPYAVMYAVGGRLIDHLGSRRGMLIFVSSWSVANMLHGFAQSVKQLSVFRFFLGATESANFPAGVKALSEWFPVRERAMAIGIFNAGTAIGGALAAPTVAFVAMAFGWRSAFVITGGLGLLWLVLWAVVYRLPADHPRLGEDERRLIMGDAPAVTDKAQEKKVPLMQLLRMRETWACILARVLTDPITYFLNLWVMKYLQEERGFTLAQVGKYGWIPFVSLGVGNLMSGAIPGLLIARGWPLDRARKLTMLVVSCAMPVFCLMVTRVQSPVFAMLFLAALFFGHACWGNIILPAELFPPKVVGVVTGLGGFLGAAVGGFAQLGIGNVVQNYSYAPVFATCAFLYLIAFSLVAWLARDLGRIRQI